MPTISPVTTSTLNWAQQGAKVPDDSMTLYALVDSFVKAAPTELKDDATAKVATDACIAVTAHVEDQVNAAMTGIPATAAKAREVAMNVLLCGTLAGTLNTAMYMARKQEPVFPGAADHNTQVLSAASKKAPEQLQTLGEGTVMQMTNVLRSQLDELTQQAAGFASKSDPGARMAYAQTLVNIFTGSYYAGSSQATLGGHSL